MYNVFYTRIIMIVGIVKIGAGLVALEEFRKADSEELAIDEFCNEYTPSLNTADYLGVDASSIDLAKSWGWDFSKATPILEEVPDENPMQEAYEIEETNGRDYFKLAKGKYFGVRLYSGELTYENLSYCYTRLQQVALRLNNGDQPLALHYLQNEFLPITQTDIDNGYTQEIHDSIVNDLDLYVNS